MENNLPKKQWFDNTVVAILLTIWVPPVGLFVLYKNTTMKPKTKWAVFAVWATIMLVIIIMPHPEPAPVGSLDLPQNNNYKGFEIKGDTATIIENLGPIIVIDQTVIDMGEHVTKYMKKVMKYDRLKKLKTIHFKYEVENRDDPHYRIATLVIPVDEWQQIPEDLREKEYWVRSHLENWKKVINYEIVMEIRKNKKRFGY